GPLISKALADHGATVVHVESRVRPDVLRLGQPATKNEPGIDRSQFFANFNSSKLGVGLDLSLPEGRAVARKLIDWADVVVESFSPGVIEAFGFGYAELSRERPDLVMVSTCLCGQTGPYAKYRGFGTQGSALAGIHGITGWPDRPPAGTWGAYTDFIAPRYGVAALAAALYDRDRTGLGQHIDLGQVEAAIHFIEPLVLDYTVNGRMAAPAGHSSWTAAPHGVFPAAGRERFVAIAVETDEQWRALAALSGLADEPGFATHQERRDRAHELNERIAKWTAGRDPWALVSQLQWRGVPASVVQWPSDLYNDPQLEHRGFFVTCHHTVMGTKPYDGPVTLFSATPPRLLAAPCLGEHSEYVLREILEMDGDSVAELAAAGVLG
ncbi:MAG TPA: CoA transferase, partial [Tepidiformaceae bacterium]